MAAVQTDMAPVIEIENLNKSFEGLDVLCGINLKVYRGENMVILGRSGSGKSVLIKIIAGLLKPDSGTVLVFGQQVDRLSIRELQQLRLRIGFSFQSCALYDGMSVRENLEFPLIRDKRNLTRKEIDDAVERVLDQVGLLQTVNQMPAELSGGQKKRISIARTLILNPEIMLYDEPTGGLDPITCGEINHLINQVREQYKTSSIIITHDLSCAKSTGDRIAMLQDGKLVKEGLFEEVFSSKEPSIRGFYNYNFISAS
jgi:phospholipid/cholesterol/gamma-HCH transport system ATP-binding protein